MAEEYDPLDLVVTERPAIKAGYDGEKAWVEWRWTVGGELTMKLRFIGQWEDLHDGMVQSITSLFSARWKSADT